MNLFRRHVDGERVTAGDLGHSQYGTPLGEILHAHVDPDYLKWFMVPAVWGRRWSGPEQWANHEAPACWEVWQEQTGAPEPDPEAVERTVAELKSYAEQFGGPRLQDPFEITTWLHLPSPTVLCLPVKVFVDDRPGLTAEQAAGVEDPDAMKPPTVEQFSTENLGPGLKVTAHGLLDPQEGSGERTAFVAVRYAFEVPGKQAVVTVTSTDTDLGRMAGAQEDLDEFVRSISLTLAGGVPIPTT